jgi:type II secretory pathway pseudopilin PulG
MLIVLVILGVVATFGISGFRTYAQKQRVTKFMTVLESDLRLGYQVAARSRQPVKLLLDATKNELRLVSATNANVVFLRRGLTDFGLTTSSLTFGSSISGFSFYPNGWANQTLSVSVTQQGWTRTLAMTKSGVFTQSVP